MAMHERFNQVPVDQIKEKIAELRRKAALDPNFGKQRPKPAKPKVDRAKLAMRRANTREVLRAAERFFEGREEEFLDAVRHGRDEDTQRMLDECRKSFARDRASHGVLPAPPKVALEAGADGVKP